MGDESTRTDVSQMSRMSDISESDIARLEELREIGKKAKTEARDMDLESLGGCSTVSKNERKRQLAIAKTHKLVLTKKKREILKEEDYLSDMDKIITESFFPHYNNLKDQHEYLDAETSNDHEKMREISMKYRKRHKERPSTGAWTTGGTPLMTPSGFETPSSPNRSGEGQSGRPNKSDSDSDDEEETEEEKAEREKKEKEKRTTGLSLDRYCVKYTSEDNDNFQQLHAFTEDKKKARYAYLYAQQEEGDRRCDPKNALKLLAPEEILAIEDSRDPKNQKKAGTGNWKYTVKNSMFYGGDKEAEKVYTFKKPFKPREIVHENTRFKKDPFLKPIAPDKLQSVVNARVRSSIREQGKVGIDGKPITPARTPYGLLGTPSPMPGQDESPFMTWGQLEATPQRAMTPGGASVSGNQTTTNPTISNAPAFYLGDVNDREDLAHRLVDKVMEKKRDAKNKTLGMAKKSAFGDTPNRIRKAMGKTPAIKSPALNNLLGKYTNKLGIGTNKSLRSSYTPSRTPGGSTPSRPGSTPRRTPGSTPGSRTPKSAGSFGSKTLGIKTKSNLTDGLI